jgi:hypothetical protein
MELTAFKEPAKLLDIEVVGCHVGVLSVPVSRDLVHHKVRISEAEDPPDAISLASLSPCTRASYSVTLFEAVKWIYST